MDKNDRDSNPDLTKTKDDVKAEETKVVEPPAKSSSSMPKFQIDPSVFDEVPGTHFPTMQAKKKRNAAAMWLVLVLVLFLATGGYAVYQYTQAAGQNDQLTQKDSQIATLTSENAKLKSDAAKTEPANPSPSTDVADHSSAYGKLFYSMLVSYSPITKSGTQITDQDKTAIEKAYKDYYKLPVAAQPLKDKAIEVMAIYKESEKTRALVYWASDGTKPANFMPFVKNSDGTWKYAG